MKSNELLLLILMPFIGLAPRQALSQSAVAMVNGRVMGLPNGNVASFQVMLVSDGAPCAVLQTHPLADGSFRFSSVRSGEYRVAVIGLPEAYGIATMTAGALDLLFNPVRVVASTQILIEVAPLEEIRRGQLSVARVGNGGLHRSPYLIHQVKAVYPSQAKTARIVGNVILSIGLDKNGYVEDAMVVQGHPLLVQSAINAVRQRRYVPTVLYGEPVRIKTTVIVPFGLK